MPELPTRTPQQNAPRIPAVRQAALNAQIRAQPELQSTSHTPPIRACPRAHGATPPQSHAYGSEWEKLPPLSPATRTRKASGIHT